MFFRRRKKQNEKNKKSYWDRKMQYIRRTVYLIAIYRHSGRMPGKTCLNKNNKNHRRDKAQWRAQLFIFMKEDISLKKM